MYSDIGKPSMDSMASRRPHGRRTRPHGALYDGFNFSAHTFTTTDGRRPEPSRLTDTADAPTEMARGRADCTDQVDLAHRTER